MMWDLVTLTGLALLAFAAGEELKESGEAEKEVSYVVDAGKKNAIDDAAKIMGALTPIASLFLPLAYHQAGVPVSYFPSMNNPGFPQMQQQLPYVPQQPGMPDNYQHSSSYGYSWHYEWPENPQSPNQMPQFGWHQNTQVFPNHPLQQPGFYQNQPSVPYYPLQQPGFQQNQPSVPYYPLQQPGFQQNQPSVPNYPLQQPNLVDNQQFLPSFPGQHLTPPQNQQPANNHQPQLPAVPMDGNPIIYDGSQNEMVSMVKSYLKKLKTQENIPTYNHIG